MRTLALAATLLALPALAQAPALKKVPARYTSPVQGAEMYQAYCASCHGPKGLGDGPVAPHLKAPLPDLSTLAKRHGGIFPKEDVAKAIRGEAALQAHGQPDMPVWGPFFRVLDRSQEPAVRIRVNHLVQHLESLQAK